MTIDLKDFMPWIESRAAKLTDNHQDWEDLVSTGVLAFLETARRIDPDRSAGEVVNFMLIRVKGAILTEWERMIGVYQHRAPLGDDFEQVQEFDEYLMMAYHEGEIAQAVARLTPSQQRYVRARFWHGQADKAITKTFGYPPHGLWHNGARKRLGSELAHLEDVYG